MTYVITEPCIGVKDGTCVQVCPVDCIHTTAQEEQFYIDPEVCIECDQCVEVCPVDAIFVDSEVPNQWESYIEKNAHFFDNLPLAVAELEASPRSGSPPGSDQP